MQLTKALNNLEVIGALQHLNWMAIEELLNSIEETHHTFQATDQDIYDMVMDMKRVQERMARSGDSGDTDDEPVKPMHTWKEALQAGLVIKEYISKLDEPFAWKL